MTPDRRQKVAALLASPIAGERAAARAALDRLEQDAIPPVVGTKEWERQRHEWVAKITFCQARLGSPLLTRAEIVTVRNFARNIGNPYEPSAAKLLAVHRKLVAAEEQHG